MPECALGVIVCTYLYTRWSVHRVGTTCAKCELRLCSGVRCCTLALNTVCFLGSHCFLTGCPQCVHGWVHKGHLVCLEDTLHVLCTFSCVHTVSSVLHYVYCVRSVAQFYCAHIWHIPFFWGGFIVDWFLSIAPVGGISHYLFTLYSFYPEAFCLNLQFLSDLFPLGDLESW